jgi:hypothetical protein
VHRECIALSITKKMQRYTTFFFAVKLYMFQAVFRPSSGAQTVHSASGVRMSSLLAATASGSSKLA